MSPAILNAERVYLSRTVVDFHRVAFQGPPSLLSQLMKFEAQPASGRVFEDNSALTSCGMSKLGSVNRFVFFILILSLGSLPLVCILFLCDLIKAVRLVPVCLWHLCHLMGKLRFLWI